MDIRYLDNDFNPVPKEQSTIVKIRMDDGKVVFAHPAGVARRFHLPDDHEQESHGNWADGSQGERLKIGPNAPSKDKPIVMVFGGSFNPMHLGHVGATKDAIRMMREAGYDVKKAIIAPSAERLLAKKLGDEAYSLADRVELAELSTRGIVDIEVTSGPAIEAEHTEGKLRRTQLANWAQRRYPDATIVNITGADQATGPGHSPPGFPSLYAGDKGSNHEGYYYFALPRPEGGISSSKIRALIAKGEPIPGDVMHPDAVKRLPKKSRKFHLEGGHDQETHGNWAREGGTESPAFKKWFGNSKAVDGEGKPLVLYHGTTKDFEEFAVGDIGYHAGTQEQAHNILKVRNGDGSILPLYMRVENPLKLPDMMSQWDDPTRWRDVLRPGITKFPVAHKNELREIAKKWEPIIEEAYGSARFDDDEHLVKAKRSFVAEMKASLEKLGYDGIRYRNKFEGKGESWVAFKPEQIKSKFNKGTYDPADKRISFYQPDNPDHDQESHGNWASGDASEKTPEQQKKAKKATVRGEVDAAAMAANVDEDALAEAFAVQHEDFNTEARFEVTGTVDEDAVREDLRDQARENIDRDELAQSLAESARDNIREDDVREEIATETRDLIHKADGGSQDVGEDYRTENILKNAGLGEDATDAEKQDAIQAFIDEHIDDQLEDRINEMVDQEVENNIDSEFDSAVDRYVDDNFDEALDNYRSNSDDQEITVHGKILDKNGNKAGDFTREIKLGERSVYHAYFFLGKDYQDKGIARDLLESSVRFYDQIGIDNVTVTANGDVGKYAWAVYGFDFDDSYTLHNKREGLLDTIQTKYKLEWEQLGEAGQAALTNQIRSLKHSWDIATFKLGNEKVGKDYLLHSSDWSGRLDLDGDGRKIFDAYIKRSKSKPVEDPNQMKLPFAKKESEFGDQDSVIVHKDILDLEDEMYEIIAKLFPVEKYERHYEDIQFRRPLSKYESRVNFARANDAFTRLISETDVKLRDALRKSQKAIIKRATDAINILNPSLAATFNVDVGDEFYRIFRDFLLDAWRDGKDQAFDELPERVKAAARQVKQFHYPGGEDHDQSTHGNWANGEQSDKIGFYSPLQRTLESAKQNSAPASDWIAIVSKGVTKDELNATGVVEWLKAKGSDKVTKDDLLAYLKDHAVQITPVVLGASAELKQLTEERDRLGAELKALRLEIVDNLPSDIRDSVASAEHQKRLDKERELQDRVNAIEDKLIDINKPKFGQYTLPGGENYREMLLTLPVPEQQTMDSLAREIYGTGVNNLGPKEQEALREVFRQRDRDTIFQSGHFDQPNIVAHLRMDDRVDADGNKILFLEEIQSDWAQQGRETGFIGDAPAFTELPPGYQVKSRKEDGDANITRYWIEDASGNRVTADSYNMEGAINNAINDLNDKARGTTAGAIPSAPFVTDTREWVGLAMKHAIVEAVKGGYDGIAWTTGEQQAERYDLSKQVDGISYGKNSDNTYWLGVKPRGSQNIDAGLNEINGRSLDSIKEADLPSVVGKEIANKILADDGEKIMVARDGYQWARNLSGVDLKVGGEGMKAFYDNIVPNVAGKIIRKSDPKASIRQIEVVFDELARNPITKEYLPGTRERHKQQGFYLTPYMREQIRKGVALFESDDDARVYHTPGGQEHDQSLHGNWATGSGAPWAQTREEFYKNNVFRAPGTSLLEQAYKLEALPDDAEIWTYLATDRATADKFLAEGIDPEQKPMNLARWRLEHGEDGVEFAPGRGLAGGTYVGGTPQDVSGYGRTILAIRTTKGKLETTPEAEALGNKNGAHALSVNDAQIKGKIAASDIIEIADNRYPGSGHEELVRAALRGGKSVPDKVLADYPDLKKFHAYAGFEPIQAINYLTSKALYIKGLLDNELTEDFRQLLLEHLKGGRTLSETLMDLRELFEPWIGDPTKIAPSGQVGINTPPGTKSPDNLLQAYRLENMIRTPIIEAYNQGRLAIGDAADDYVIGYEYSAILDTRTTEICFANDGLLIRKDDPRLIKLTPPVHYQCRSLLVYVTIDDTPVEWSDDEELDAAVARIQDGFS